MGLFRATRYALAGFFVVGLTTVFAYNVAEAILARARLSAEVQLASAKSASTAQTQADDHTYFDRVDLDRRVRDLERTDYAQAQYLNELQQSQVQARLIKVESLVTTFQRQLELLEKLIWSLIVAIFGKGTYDHLVLKKIRHSFRTPSNDCPYRNVVREVSHRGET